MKNRLKDLKNAKAKSISTAEKVSCSVFSEELGFPYLVKSVLSGTSLSYWLKENRSLFDEKLLKHGGVLFRGFEIDTVEKFQGLVSFFSPETLEYKQRSSPRYEVGKNVYHSTTYPADQPIEMHSESSYSRQAVSNIIFCCIVPAEEGGETPIADNRKVLELLSDELRDKFRKLGVRYVRNISPTIGLSWQEIFQTENKAEVEAECQRNEMDFKWFTDEKLSLYWTNDAIVSHPITGEDTWFNHAFFFNKYVLGSGDLAEVCDENELPFHTSFGDGSPISKEEIEEIRSAYEKSTVKFPWEKGDVLFLDNRFVSHSRSAYKGERQTIVSMF